MCGGVRWCVAPGGVGAAEWEANLRANISDCLEVLGKLATGIDVNIRCAPRSSVYLLGLLFCCHIPLTPSSWPHPCHTHTSHLGYLCGTVHTAVHTVAQLMASPPHPHFSFINFTPPHTPLFTPTLARWPHYPAPTAPRFNHPLSVEPTREVAVFDLLGKRSAALETCWLLSSPALCWRPHMHVHVHLIHMCPTHPRAYHSRMCMHVPHVHIAPMRIPRLCHPHQPRTRARATPACAHGMRRGV